MSKNELTQREVDKLYHFSVRKIADLCLTANPGSTTYKKAMKVFEGKGINHDALFDFLSYDEKLRKKTPLNPQP
jgi:hypothetical protein